MPRTSYTTRHPIPGIKQKYVEAGMDMRFIVRNWRAINETPIKKAGLLIRQIMRGSIRRQPKISPTTGKPRRASQPGRPPYARTGVGKGQNPPFKRIYSVPYGDNTKAVIGHEKLPIKKQDPRVTPMQAHEFGMNVRRRMTRKTYEKAKSEKQKRAARKKYLAGELKQRKKQYVTRRVKMPKRRFAFPALMKARAKIGQFWKGIIRKSGIRS